MSDKITSEKSILITKLFSETASVLSLAFVQKLVSYIKEVSELSIELAVSHYRSHLISKETGTFSSLDSTSEEPEKSVLSMTNDELLVKLFVERSPWMSAELTRGIVSLIVENPELCAEFFFEYHRISEKRKTEIVVPDAAGRKRISAIIEKRRYGHPSMRVYDVTYVKYRYDFDEGLHYIISQAAIGRFFMELVDDMTLQEIETMKQCGLSPYECSKMTSSQNKTIEAAMNKANELMGPERYLSVLRSI